MFFSAIGFVIGSGVLALLCGLFLIRSVLSYSTGTERMKQIAGAIQEGARAYLNLQYTVITLVGIVIVAFSTWKLGWGIGILAGIGYVFGAVHQTKRCVKKS